MTLPRKGTLAFKIYSVRAELGLPRRDIFDGMSTTSKRSWLGRYRRLLTAFTGSRDVMLAMDTNDLAARYVVGMDEAEALKRHWSKK